MNRQRSLRENLITLIEMKKGPDKKKMIKVSKSALLALVASKLKDRELFPQKNEDARNYLKNAHPSA